MSATRGSFEWRTQQVSTAIRLLKGKDWNGWTEETYPDSIIVRDYNSNVFWRVPYTLDEVTDEVVLGEWNEIEQTWATITKDIRVLVPVRKATDAPRRITYGVVLEPDSVDLQGDVMKAIDIELSAHEWMIESQVGGDMHESIVDGAAVVESYIAPCDIVVKTAGGEETIMAGSWVLAMKWPQEVWKRIEKGELTGYSVGGQGVRISMEEESDD